MEVRHHFFGIDGIDINALDIILGQARKIGSSQQYMMGFIYMDLPNYKNIRNISDDSYHITSDKVLLSESEPTILMAEWLTKAQGRLFHEATRQSHSQALNFFAIHCNEEWIT